MNDAYTLLGATVLALLCLLSGRLHAQLKTRDGALLSVSTGVGVAYLFVDVMPHLAKMQDTLRVASAGGLYGFLAHHAYLVALAGFYIFYLASVRTMEHTKGSVGLPVAIRAYVVAGAAGYFGLISYMLAEQPDHRAEPLILFASAMAIHAVGITQFLRDRLAETYDRSDRFILASVVAAGWLLGSRVDIPDVVYALWFSLLAGGIFGVVAAKLSVVNTPRRLAHFAIGASTLSALLIVVERYASLD